MDVDDGFLDFIAKLIEEDQHGVYVPVESRIDLVNNVYEVVKTIFKQVDSTTLTFNKPFKGMGVISVEGRTLECLAPDYFVKVSKLASNINIYPKVDGTVHMDFCFYGVEKKVSN